MGLILRSWLHTRRDDQASDRKAENSPPDEMK